MKDEIKVDFIICDLCKKQATHVFYWSVTEADEESFLSLHNNGLYCKECINVIKTMPIISPTPEVEK